MDPCVLDVFAQPATPAFRRARPALCAARMAWAGQRLAAAFTGAFAGYAPGDTVIAELRPGVAVRGVVEFWRTLRPLPGCGTPGRAAQVRLTATGRAVLVPAHRLRRPADAADRAAAQAEAARP